MVEISELQFVQTAKVPEKRQKFQLEQKYQQVIQNEVFCDSKMNQVFFLSELFSTNTPKSAAHAQEERPMSDEANLDKRGREPGTGRIPDKKEARVDRGTGSDASAALAALDGGPELQSCSVTG